MKTIQSKVGFFGPALYTSTRHFRLAQNTGHSVDTERPRWMAEQIVEFLR